MAIRPVDLQLAYLAAPVNAAIADHAQNAPQVAQAAAQAAFAAQVREREEHVDKTAKAEGNRVKARSEGERDGRPAGDEHREASDPESDGGLPFDLAGDGEHFIDVSA